MFDPKQSRDNLRNKREIFQYSERSEKILQLTLEHTRVKGTKPRIVNLTTVIPLYPWGIGSRAPHRCQNPRMLKSLI